MLQKQKFNITDIYVPVKRIKLLEESKVTELAEGILNGEDIVPIRVRADGKRFVLIKGMHTLEALRALGEEQIEGYLVRAQLH
ncbi:chromosome partitioning protein ParB [Paracoccaceae bacterium]|jgi:sulfiredoxin|nr:chromosome partitioning protein ParB [Paracoccaceae bacterium]MDA9228499.1 chromosome partitioning protein ParB [Paracoccaceae bacterium]|tara:strand:- start:132 stop:380 length:249 start_codon:yes stop_codon:yes gene_type:complete